MKSQEFRKKRQEEIVSLLEEIDKEIFMYRNELKMSRKLEHPHLLKEKKKTRARILTILAEKMREKNEQR